MSVIYVNEEEIVVPTGCECTGCPYSQTIMRITNNITRKSTVTTKCTLFNKDTPEGVKLAKCVISTIR